MRSPFKIFFGDPEGNKPVGRPRRRCGDNININLIKIEIGCENVQWIQLMSSCKYDNSYLHSEYAEIY
jgi:hypothetical protein